MTVLSLNDELAILKISGDDASAYLQGQITNDINLLTTNNQFQFAAHLNPKGRILATFIIVRLEDNSYYLITTREIAAKITPRLKMFILRSKVSLQDSKDNIYLSPAKLPDGINLEISVGHFLVISPQQLAADKDSNHWHQFIVENTVPLIYPQSQEKIIPQQINYDLLDGISFKKGCYTGQEIVARTHYLGKIKRRLVKFNSTTQPQIGQSIVSPVMENQEVGIIVDYYHDKIDNCYHGLASLQNNCLEQAYLDIQNQQQIICQSLITTEGA